MTFRGTIAYDSYSGETSVQPVLYLGKAPTPGWLHKPQRLEESSGETYIVNKGFVWRCSATSEAGERYEEPRCSTTGLRAPVEGSLLSYLLQGPRIFAALGGDAERSSRTILGYDAKCWSWQEESSGWFDFGGESLEICYSDDGIPLAYRWSYVVLSEGAFADLTAVSVERDTSGSDFELPWSE